MSEKFKITKREDKPEGGETIVTNEKTPSSNEAFYTNFLEKKLATDWTGEAILKRAITESKTLIEEGQFNMERVTNFLDRISFNGAKNFLHLLSKDLKNSNGFLDTAKEKMGLTDSEEEKLVMVLDCIKDHYEDKFLEQESPEIMQHIKTDFGYKEPKRINVVQNTRNPIVIQEEKEEIMRLKNELGIDEAEAPKRINIKPR